MPIFSIVHTTKYTFYRGNVAESDEVAAAMFPVFATPPIRFDKTSKKFLSLTLRFYVQLDLFWELKITSPYRVSVTFVGRLNSVRNRVILSAIRALIFVTL